jgi:5-methylcytosine-specific restriction endonuclease McrA
MKAAQIRRAFKATKKNRKKGSRSDQPVAKRSAPRGKARQAVRKLTNGRCHVCGGRLGSKWHVDHVVHVQLGGASKADNYLPICRKCNRLRWSYRPEVLRLMIDFGILAKQEIRNKTALGEDLLARYQRVRRTG